MPGKPGKAVALMEFYGDTAYAVGKNGSPVWQDVPLPGPRNPRASRSVSSPNGGAGSGRLDLGSFRRALLARARRRFAHNLGKTAHARPGKVGRGNDQIQRDKTLLLVAQR